MTNVMVAFILLIGFSIGASGMGRGVQGCMNSVAQGYIAQ